MGIPLLSHVLLTTWTFAIILDIWNEHLVHMFNLFCCLLLACTHATATTDVLWPIKFYLIDHWFFLLHSIMSSIANCFVHNTLYLCKMNWCKRVYMYNCIKYRLCMCIANLFRLWIRYGANSFSHVALFCTSIYTLITTDQLCKL